MKHHPIPRDKILVFGSNTEGRHGAGMALYARKYHGAIYGKPEGLQGNSYAIPTKNLKKGKRSIPLSEIRLYIDIFLDFATTFPEKEFYISPIGCNLAGYKVEEIAPMFKDCPVNVELCPEFKEYLSKQNS